MNLPETPGFGWPIIEAVRTDVPAFIGYTHEAGGEGTDSEGPPSPRWVRSMSEFEERFGGPFAERLTVTLTPGSSPSVAFAVEPPEVPRFLLHYAVRMFFSNGGEACWVVSVGRHGPDGAGVAINEAALREGIRALEDCPEPALIVVPDAVALEPGSFGRVVDQALAVASAFPPRFTILDVPGALPGQTSTDDDVTRDVRARIGAAPRELRYGAAYFPYLRTRIPLHWSDRSVKVLEPRPRRSRGGRARLEEGGRPLDQLRSENASAYAAVRQFLAPTLATLPPSGAVAGAFARVDRTRGVWKAPANVALQDVVEPAVGVSAALNERLNAHTSGMSVNSIRAYSGRGTLIWGARTLAADSPEFRYVPVRRLLSFIETSIYQGVEPFTFEPNEPNTWRAVRTAIETFLMRLWRSGAVVGTKADEAFFVKVGLGETMTSEDVDAGRLKVQMGVAAVRPAEFHVLMIEREVGR